MCVNLDTTNIRNGGSYMKKEIDAILLGVLTNRTNDEEERFQELITNKLDWAWLTGQLIRHRVNGNFYCGMNNDQRKYIVGKVKQTFELLSDCYKACNVVNLTFVQELFEVLNENEITVAGLKGVIYNTSIYKLGARRSNDIDILIAEENLAAFDNIMREFGFIQSFDGGYTEASKKDKIIQIMNYHDLVPYFKRIDLPYMNSIKVDINFQFDSKEHEITKEILDEGIQIYEGNGFKVQGLKWNTHLSHLCVHFYREATNSLWTSKARDIDLYKLVDIENSFRQYTYEKMIEWVKTIEMYNLEKQCYYTLYYLNQFYPNKTYNKIMDMIELEDVTFLNEIVISGQNKVVKRKTDFSTQTFDMNYGQNFEESNYSKVF